MSPAWHALIVPHFSGFFDARALAVDFRSIGFRECLTEVIRYLGVLEGPSSRADPVRIRLLSHLNSYAAEMEPSPTPPGPLAFPAWPWSFFHSCPGLSAPSNQLAILGRVPGPMLPNASSLAYPIPALRAAPLRRAAGTILPARRNLLPSRGASSTRRARAPWKGQLPPCLRPPVAGPPGAATWHPSFGLLPLSPLAWWGLLLMWLFLPPGPLPRG